MRPEEYLADVEIHWCPGCGNFQIREALVRALAALDLPPHRVVLVTGIGQAAKIVHYLRVNGFDGLHGRTIAAAAGLKMARPDLEVIAESGDGDLYGEGGNHLLHNIRRNLDITVIVHDNRVYGLTKGQASPTAPAGYITRAQPFGVLSRPLNPLALALALGAGFVAQASRARWNALPRSSPPPSGIGGSPWSTCSIPAKMSPSSVRPSFHTKRAAQIPPKKAATGLGKSWARRPPPRPQENPDWPEENAAPKQ